MVYSQSQILCMLSYKACYKFGTSVTFSWCAIKHILSFYIFQSISSAKLLSFQNSIKMKTTHKIIFPNHKGEYLLDLVFNQDLEINQCKRYEAVTTHAKLHVYPLLQVSLDLVYRYNLPWSLVHVPSPVSDTRYNISETPKLAPPPLKIQDSALPP